MNTKNINPSWFMFSVLFMCFSLECHVSFAVDTISSNQSLSGNLTIVSAGGVFQLGFFRPGKSSNYYVGMWYKTVSQLTTVWVANGDKPILDIYSSVLKISDGNLVLFNESQVPIWSTNVSSANSSSVVAVLLDDGNLVLRDGPNSSTILWQSFDHPTDTWLPGSKLRLNKRTNQSQRFTSWKSQDDPAPGLYSFELDPRETNKIFIVWNRSQPFWNSGTWDEQTKSFSLVPEMRMDSMSNSSFNFSYFSNENESYFIYYFYNSSTATKLFMDVSGQIKQMSWLDNSKRWNLFFSQPRQQCEVYAFCGAFGSCNEKSLPFCNCLTGFQPTSQQNWNLQQDYSEGCVRKTKLQCDNASVVGIGRGDQFLESRETTFPTNPQNTMADSSMECKSTCLKNCSCNAYAYENNLCSIWIGDLSNLQQLGQDDTTGKTLYIKMVASEISSESSPTNKKGVIVVAVAVPTGLLLLGLVMFIIIKRRTIITAEPAEGSLVAFAYRDLQKATKNFSEELGKGGFGSVFKGTLPDGSIIAVKKLESMNQGEKQFRAEVSTIGKINHVNLVRLRGFCSEGSRKLLVYDCMPNGSLDRHLFHAKDSETLDWKARYQIALGAARGLAYLHENCIDSIIHCDIKPENILLDVDYCPKLADFGLAKLLGREFSRVLTTMRGTMGYLAPEWISGVAITSKADVYSFGMMLLEFVSGKRNFERTNDEEGTFFPSWAARQVVEGADLLKLLDSRLNGNANLEELSRTCKVACWCIQDDEIQRPSMNQVVQILEGVLDLSLPPIPRLLDAFINDQEHIFFFTDSTLNVSSKGTSNALAAVSPTKSISS